MPDEDLVTGSPDALEKLAKKLKALDQRGSFKNLATALLLLLWAATASAQPPPLVVTQYQLTRYVPGPVQSTIFQKSTMTCGLPVGIPPSTGIRITDPLNAALDCQLLGNINGVLVPATATHDYRIMAATADGIWSPEHILTNLVPPAPPTGGRARPPASASIAAEGVVNGPLSAFAGVQVANVVLDGYNLLVHFGAPTLNVPGVYDVRQGDRFAFSFWR